MEAGAAGEVNTANAGTSVADQMMYGAAAVKGEVSQTGTE